MLDVFPRYLFSFYRTNDIIDEIQQPCSEVLVRLCRARPNIGGSNKSAAGSYIGRVMDALMTKFQPGAQTHYYVITTLSAIAVVNPIGMIRAITFSDLLLIFDIKHTPGMN